MKYIFLLLAVFVSSCGKTKDTKIEGVEMGMAYKILIREKISHQILTKIKKITKKTFDEVDITLNHWNKNSEISQWNNSRSTKPKEISPFLLEAIKIADQVHKLSDGKYDPSTGKVIHLWKMSLRMGKTLSEKELAPYKDSTGWDKVVIHKSSIQKMHPDLEIDLDGIAKGYFCDILTQRLREFGLKNFLVEWAGEIKVSGGPFNILSQGKIISLKDQAIATSGPCFQIYSVNKTIYSHFIDPKTLRFIEIKDPSFSNSITSDSCAIADGLATASLLN